MNEKDGISLEASIIAKPRNDEIEQLKSLLGFGSGLFAAVGLVICTLHRELRIPTQLAPISFRRPCKQPFTASCCL